MSSRSYYAAAGKLTDWAKKLPVGAVLQSPDGMLYIIEQNETLYLGVNGTAWTHEQFGKLSFDLKLNRVCANCKRPRKEHLKKAKCLFGASVWK